ncbi:MAG: hypothetical protein DCC67_18605 [Planctomycetota bacterium]|nr:MAG: hypothetical protein DCC67_18605 [Planctomycetota bacterium]
MKTVLSTLALASVLVAGACDARAAQLLLNGNLDATVVIDGQPRPDDWVIDASRAISGPFTDGLSSEPWAGPAPTPVTANDQGVFFKPFQGNATDGDVTVHLYQDAAATPGIIYLFSGWAGAEANYSGLIPGSRTRTELAVEFLGPAGLIASSVLHLPAAGLGGAAGQPFGYNKYTVAGIAPAGSTTVRGRVSMINAFANPAGGGQALVVDDFELSQIPEPATTALLACGLAGLALVRRR